ncbi:hypothetical protein, partial [Candidatus Avelusimicrobium facis]|uniref:hypothetical protein n=1 Tax=Candidatus Avelusimicrobium facis TaxID=3416203 RepID=UPI003D0D1D7E
PTLFSQRENNRAGNARPLALPKGELARLKAVSERVPSGNHPTVSVFETAQTLSGSLIARQLSQRESQGRLRPQNNHHPADKPGRSWPRWKIF